MVPTPVRTKFAKLVLGLLALFDLIDGLLVLSLNTCVLLSAITLVTIYCLVVYDYREGVLLFAFIVSLNENPMPLNSSFGTILFDVSFAGSNCLLPL
mgnify:CR=1 FL=1